MVESGSIAVFYTTLPSLEAARAFASTLLAQKLVACAHCLPAGTSWYEWDATMQETEEVALLLKTHSAHKTALEKAVSQHHPYEVPCLIELTTGSTLPSYLDWVRKSCDL